MKKVLVICGPTATGKTPLGIHLARKFNGEIISADSRQVYQGMDIGTGKDHPRSVKIHLIDVVWPDQEFSVSQYYHLAWQAIRKIWQKGKLPILVGGTGFYIKAVVEGVETSDVPRNLPLRAKISHWSAEKLFKHLTRLDPEKVAALNWSDKNNPYRLVRAIEVAVFKKENPCWQPPKHQKPEVLFIGLTAPFKFLYQKIDQRVEKRVKKGIKKEIRGLLKKGFSWETSALGDTLGYQEWRRFFEDKASKEEVIQRWKFNEHSYARRQMTWFKKALRQAQGEWFDIRCSQLKEEVAKRVREWYSKNNAAKN